MFLDTLVLLYLHSRLYTKERLRTLGVEGVFIHLLALVDASLSFPHGLKIQFVSLLFHSYGFNYNIKAIHSFCVSY